MIKKISLGAGCFWGVEVAFMKLAGVKSTSVGYQGGTSTNPSYEEVCHMNTGHIEITMVEYDDDEVSLDNVLSRFWEIHNPTLINKQGPDIGTQYQSAIFYYHEEDLPTINEHIEKINRSGQYPDPVSTKVLNAEDYPYYRGEEFHQKYLIKNPGGYCHINLDKL